MFKSATLSNFFMGLSIRLGLSQKQCISSVNNILSKIVMGSIELIGPDGAVKVFGDRSRGKSARLKVNDNRFYTSVITGGETGFGEAYVEGFWDSDDLAGLLKILVENRSAISDGNLIISSLSRILNYAQHIIKANTIQGSRKNVSCHYDLSNEFFSIFLDTSMTYSSGIFLSNRDTLEQAQKNKIHRIIELARISEDDHVLEIGCGWGSFAIEAVRQKGCRVTGITISKQQYEYAMKKVLEEGLDNRITVLLEDYRTIKGRYDKIVSIEMLEAVGHEYLGAFFNMCDRMLCPDGLAVIQVITLPDQRYDQHRKESDWIKKYIFPGGHLPSLSAMCDAMTSHSSLMIEHIDNIGIHYARTLEAWRNSFLEAADRIDTLGFDRTFQRKWLYYLSICEALFAVRAVSDLQMVLTREGNMGLSKPV